MYTHNGASAKFSTNSHETDYSVSFSRSENIARLSQKIHIKIRTRIYLKDRKKQFTGLCILVTWHSMKFRSRTGNYCRQKWQLYMVTEALNLMQDASNIRWEYTALHTVHMFNNVGQWQDMINDAKRWKIRLKESNAKCKGNVRQVFYLSEAPSSYDPILPLPLHLLYSIFIHTGRGRGSKPKRRLEGQ